MIRRGVVEISWLLVVLEPEHFFRELHWVQGLSAVHPSGAAVSGQGLHTTGGEVSGRMDLERCRGLLLAGFLGLPVSPIVCQMSPQGFSIDQQYPPSPT